MYFVVPSCASFSPHFPRLCLLCLLFFLCGGFVGRLNVIVQIHKEIGGTVIRRFVIQELQKQGKIDGQGVAFLANIQSRLAMPQDVRRISMLL